VATDSGFVDLVEGVAGDVRAAVDHFHAMTGLCELARIRRAREAGADQVLIQAITGGDGPPRDAWRRLAPVLTAA
jgi:hypothetical protein